MSSYKEKRTFRRYKHSSAFSFTAADHSCPAVTIDYSLKGIGFSLENILPVPLGTSVHFTIDDLRIDDEGKIIWAENIGSRIRGGIERKTISGFLKYFPLGDMLIDMHRSRMTGLLDIRHEKSIKRIYLSHGEITSVTSNREEDRFIEVLLRTGMITNDQYYQILQMVKKSDKSPGAISVELGYLGKEDILSGIRRQAEEIVISLFFWDDGRFVFVEDLQLPENSVRLKLSAVDLAFRGIKMIRSREFLSEALLMGNDVMIHSSSAMDLLTEIGLDTADRDILLLVNNTRRVRDILASASGNEIDTLRTLYALKCTGIIESAETEQEPPQEDTRFFEKVGDLHARLADIDYYSFLGIEKRATLDTIRKAYYQAVKEFHPDKHLHLPSDTVKNQLNMIFSHLIEVYRVLSNPATRFQYDQGLMIKPSPLQTNTAEMARIKFREGKAEFKNGAYDRAKELFEQALYLDATVASYSYYMALALEKEDRYSEAGKMLNQALRIEPFNADYLAELGHVYLRLGFSLRAKSAFEKALQSSPSHKNAIEGLRKIST
ncbi:MAG: DnaJ domain-containing protein [Thermodesulfovibrionales bacterium]|nr:DnaJ domain-containing protein [Thermodesulfovibrionales bacterium]